MNETCMQREDSMVESDLQGLVNPGEQLLGELRRETQ
jgi:hypothetical protein